MKLFTIFLCSFFITKFNNPFFLDIPSSYANILGGKKFRPREFSRSGSKAKDREKEKKEKKKKERLNDGDNNGQATHGTRKHAWHTQAAWDKRREKD